MNDDDNFAWGPLASSESAPTHGRRKSDPLIQKLLVSAPKDERASTAQKARRRPSDELPRFPFSIRKR